MRFSEELINWYKVNKRDLPWRKTTDPYIVWLSEIILQQTRVDQGMSYFHSFIENYPNVESLANAGESEILKLWQGLGYYSRARNLHFTAKTICKEYNGVFPKDYKSILSLKGVGEYTAAAITSFSYNMPYPVIDGNVYRVLARIYGINNPIDSTKGKKEFKALAEKLIDKKQPADYNQAIMEFGALQCKPKSPNCADCIFRLECYAYNNNKIEELPYKEKKIKQKDRYFNYIVVLNNDKTYIGKREGDDIWKGLFEFPLIETENNINDFSIIQNNDIIKKSTLLRKSRVHKHILSHQKIFSTFWEVKVKNKSQLNDKYLEINFKEINKYAVPKLIENYINSIL